MFIDHFSHLHEDSYCKDDYNYDYLYDPSFTVISTVVIARTSSIVAIAAVTASVTTTIAAAVTTVTATATTSSELSQRPAILMVYFHLVESVAPVFLLFKKSL